MKVKISPARRLAWAVVLDDWLKRSAISQEDLAKEEMGEPGPRNLRNWTAGSNLPQAGSLTNLLAILHRWRDRETQQPLSPTAILDWLALLGFSAEAVLKLAPAGPVRDWLAEGLRSMLTWPAPALPVAYVERDLTETVMKTLIELKDYRQPQQRVVVLHGLPDSGKRCLATAVLRREAVRQYFRSGGQWLTEAELGWLLKPGSWFKGHGKKMSAQQAWWEWCGHEETVGVVVVEDIHDQQMLEQLLPRLGPQVRLLLIVTDPDEVSRVLSNYLAPAEVAYFRVEGLSFQESEKLLKAFWPQAPAETDLSYLSQVAGQINQAGPLRFLISQAVEVGWDTVWRWIWEAQDADTPLLGHWERLLALAWQRLRGEEQKWFHQLTRGLAHGSSFGPYYAAGLWGCKETQAMERLRVLERRGWIEGIDEVSQGTPARLAYLLGEQRYRLVRTGWAFVRAQSGKRISSWQWITLTLRLEWRLRKIVQPSGRRLLFEAVRGMLFYDWSGFDLIGSWIWHLATKQIKFNSLKPADLLLSPHQVKLIQLWKKQGLWPPEEIWFLYEARRSEALLSPLIAWTCIMSQQCLVVLVLVLLNILIRANMWGWQEDLLADYQGALVVVKQQLDGAQF